MAKCNTGPLNPMWKGGRTLNHHGYYLVRAGEDRIARKMAQSTGYVLEHRLVAAKKLGRPLKRNEQVHHKDGDKTNNDPDNIEVVATNACHAVRHRKRQGRRLPDEPNPLVLCCCNCGGLLRKYDEEGRPRSYIRGHNRKRGKWVQRDLFACAA